MTPARGSALAIGAVAAFALGVWTAPAFRPMETTADGSLGSEVAAEMSAMESTQAPAARTASGRATADEAVPMLSASEASVQQHVKPLLAPGTDVAMASVGFRDAEQFVTVAYAARNTEVPFAVLKDHVLTKNESLASAIRAFKPDLNGSLEAIRAKAEARSDLARLQG